MAEVGGISDAHFVGWKVEWRHIYPGLAALRPGLLSTRPLRGLLRLSTACIIVVITGDNRLLREAETTFRVAGTDVVLSPIHSRFDLTKEDGWLQVLFRD